MPRFSSGLIMKSSMGISKSAAFRFMLLLHLFLKVKMCVGFADAAAVAVAAGDSDINYDDSDEWLEGKERARSSWSASPSPPPPAPASLMRWDGVDSPRGHHPPRMHHVRHEQHYLKHGSVQLPGRIGSGAMVPSEPSGPYYAHTVTTSTVTGPQHNQQRHNVPDRGHHHKQHQHHQHHHHQHPKPQSRSSGEKRDWFDQFSSRELPNGLSGARGSRSPQEVVSRKSSTATFRDAPAVSNALPYKSPTSADGVSKTSVRSMNPHSQKYFEDLLTEYKRRSPYYKELHHQESRSPQTKALATGKGKSRGSSSADATKKVNAKVTETDYDDYMYDDDEVDEDVQNDAAYGGEASTSTKAPTTTTTTTAAPTTTTTTSRSVDSLDGDSDYSAHLKQAYSMRSNPARRGNNRYSNMPRQSPPASNNQHSGIDMVNQVRDSEEYPPLTRYKMENYGTPEAVAKSYRKYQPNTNINEKVALHIDRIRLEGSCRVPKPKLVPPPSDRNVIYFPQCTILHRCDDSTGCCMDTETCVPKATAEVELYFSVSRIGRNRQQAVAIKMTNHTECHCVRKGMEKAVPRSTANQPVVGFDWDAIGSAETDVPVCNCPEFYKPIFDSGSKCYCDCVSGAKECMRFKEGHEHFSLLTRKKILSNQFQTPSCEYGTYNRSEGRCPTKSERMDSHFSRYR